MPLEELGESDHRPEYPFIADLARDHPEIAQDIRERVEQWRQWMDQQFGDPRVAETLLNAIAYVSRDEMNLS